VESINAVSQSTSRSEDAHIAAFASFELGMLKAQSAQNATVSVLMISSARFDNAMHLSCFMLQNA